MGREVDEHQHELAALQDAHRQKMADMAKRHRDELAEYEERIEELEEQIQSGEENFCLFLYRFLRRVTERNLTTHSLDLTLDPCLQELLLHCRLQQPHHPWTPPNWKSCRPRFAPCAKRRSLRTQNAES